MAAVLSHWFPRLKQVVYDMEEPPEELLLGYDARDVVYLAHEVYRERWDAVVNLVRSFEIVRVQERRWAA